MRFCVEEGVVNNVHWFNVDTFMGIWVLSEVGVVHICKLHFCLKGDWIGTYLRYQTCMGGIDLLCKYMLECDNSYSVHTERALI